MKKVIFAFVITFFAVCFQGYGQTAEEKGAEKAEGIVKFLKIYDQNQTRMIKIACEEYFKKYEEIENEPDPEKRKIKHLRNEQKFEARLKSVTTPEQYRNYETGLKNKKKAKS
jgi:hypothetical protein